MEDAAAGRQGRQARPAHRPGTLRLLPLTQLTCIELPVLDWHTDSHACFQRKSKVPFAFSSRMLRRTLG